MEFIGQDITVKDYEALLDRVDKSNLLQGYDYAYAIRMHQNLFPQLSVIKEGDKEIGFFQLHHASTFFGLFHVLTLDRGPLWFDGHGTKEEIVEFIKLLNKKFPDRIGRVRRFTPEIEHNSNKGNAALFKKHGWEQKTDIQPYKTIYLDISKKLEDIRDAFNPKWRNHLNKSEKSHLNCHEDTTGSLIETLIHHYVLDKEAKGYEGPSPELLLPLFQCAATNGNLLILSAHTENEIVAMIGIIKHGKTATYQIGWTTAKGRETQAHYLLLWNAIRALKKDKIVYFDLGGINEEHAGGVTQFKNGMSGKEVKLIGQFG